MIYLYVIKSNEKNYRYIGITNELSRRLKQHNTGCNKSTKIYKPFTLIHSEEFQNYKEARKREVFLKSGIGRKFLDNLQISCRGGGTGRHVRLKIV
ncbi:MAG: GIY-YIG nuclease family protein [bacterium]